MVEKKAVIILTDIREIDIVYNFCLRFEKQWIIRFDTAAQLFINSPLHFDF